MSGRDQKSTSISEEEQAARLEETAKRATLLKQRLVEAGAQRIELNRTFAYLSIRFENPDPIAKDQATVVLADDITRYMGLPQPAFVRRDESSASFRIHIGDVYNNGDSAVVTSKRDTIHVQLVNPIRPFDRGIREEHDRIRKENTDTLWAYAQQFGPQIEGAGSDSVIDLTA